MESRSVVIGVGLGKGVTAEGQPQVVSGLMELICILTVVVVTQIHMYIKIHT